MEEGDSILESLLSANSKNVKIKLLFSILVAFEKCEQSAENVDVKVVKIKTAFEEMYLANKR